MSGHFILDWSSLTISLVNLILLTWLGLTVLFNAERRNWGVFLAVGGLFAGAGFFLGHSIVLSQGAASLVGGIHFWWWVGWILLILSPFVWYQLMLWYSGFWDDRGSVLRRRQTPWFWFSILYTLLLIGLLNVTTPFFDTARDSHAEANQLPSLGEIPIIFLVYSPYLLACIGLTLDALLRPEPSHRIMGDLARRRARPWLIGSSLNLLLTSILVCGLTFWLIRVIRQNTLDPAMTPTDLLSTYSTTLSIFDLILAAMLLGIVLMLGQAIVSYEIFTGMSLPRRGFLKQWRYTTVLALVLGSLAAYGLSTHSPVVYTLLGMLVLAAFSSALFSRLSYVERELSIGQLRPLVANQHLFDNILSWKNLEPSRPIFSAVDLEALFESLCNEALGISRAALIPLGSLAALGIPPIHYPIDEAHTLPRLSDLADQDLLAHLTSPKMSGHPLDPGQAGGFLWVAPLWSERGLIGLLLLGEKSDHGNYSLEEIEIARASGERLADVLTSAEIARRLIHLQRQRLMESSVLDRRAHRMLHDDVLPHLHTVLLQLGTLPTTSNPPAQDAIDLLTRVHRQISDLLRDLPGPPSMGLARLGLVNALHRVIEDELSTSFDEVIWQVETEVESRARDLPALAAEVLYAAAREAIRNAARHARSQEDSRSLRLTFKMYWRAGVEIQIEDNGVGLPASGVRSSDNGHGLALHSTMMAVINGSLSLESAPGGFTRVVLNLPESAFATWIQSDPVTGQ